MARFGLLAFLNADMPDEDVGIVVTESNLECPESDLCFRGHSSEVYAALHVVPQKDPFHCLAVYKKLTAKSAHMVARRNNYYGHAHSGNVLRLLPEAEWLYTGKSSRTK